MGDVWTGIAVVTVERWRYVSPSLSHSRRCDRRFSHAYGMFCAIFGKRHADQDARKHDQHRK
jgi:hypothetical protein